MEDKLPGIASGQVAGCVADFTGEGAQGMAVVLADSACVAVTREPCGSEQCARTVLSSTCGKPGPVRLCASAGKRNLGGAWNLSSGAVPAFPANADAGPLS